MDATDAVMAAEHPSPKAGGPCATCAFRPGTEANRTEHTVALARMCVEGLVPFHCHEKNQTCRGWNAAVNLRGAPESKEDRRHMEASRMIAEMLSEAIDFGRRADEAAGVGRR